MHSPTPVTAAVPDLCGTHGGLCRQNWKDVLTAGRVQALCALWSRTGPPAPAIPAAMHAFAADLVVALAKPASCILVFLPGLAEICEFAELLHGAAARLASHPASFLNRAPRRRDTDLQVRILHSLRLFRVP